uniref:Potassium channel domain-containing protein n=1 Tax=Plectus sambesii TaxID=2011161 RepID=A0A914W2Q9_9BILA
MASERVRRDSFLSDMLSTRTHHRLHPISEHLSRNHCSSEEALPEKIPLPPDDDIVPYPRMRKNTLPAQCAATIHAVWPRRKTFMDELYTLPPMPLSATVHALRPERRTRLDELSFGELHRLRNLSRHTSISLPQPSPLVSERMLRMQMIEQYLNERGADLVVPATLPTSSFFRLDFHNNLIDELKKLSHSSETHWLYWYLHILFKYTGVKHLALTLLLVCYALIGGVVFQNIEYSYEREVTSNTAANVMSAIAAYAASLNRSAFASNVNMTEHLMEFYLKTLSVDGYTSSLDRTHDDNATWTYQAGTFYAMTLLSTIGYGTIACRTTWGKVATVIYVTIGLPLMLIVIRDLGLVIFLALEKTYNRFHVTQKEKTNKPYNEDLTRSFPLSLAILLTYMYLMVLTLIVFFFDEEAADAGSNSLSLGNCFYFSFISLTTIGLGDVMPLNIHYSPFFAGIFLSGLALISTVNTATYARIERKYFNAMSALERVLLELELDEDKRKRELHESEQHPKQEHPQQAVVSRQPVFHNLLEVVRLAALIIPNLENKLDDALVKSYEALDDIQSVNSWLTSEKTVDESNSSIYAIDRNGWMSEHVSTHNSYKTLESALNGKRSDSAPTLASSPTQPTVSIVVESASPEILNERECEKRFTVCPVQDRGN